MSDYSEAKKPGWGTRVWRALHIRGKLEECDHKWKATGYKERLGGEYYSELICQKCGKQLWM